MATFYFLVFLERFLNNLKQICYIACLIRMFIEKKYIWACSNLLLVCLEHFLVTWQHFIACFFRKLSEQYLLSELHLITHHLNWIVYILWAICPEQFLLYMYISLEHNVMNSPHKSSLLHCIAWLLRALSEQFDVGLIHQIFFFFKNNSWMM